MAAVDTLGPVRSPNLLERWRALRNQILGSPGFQRWAAAFPLTRAVARRRSRALFDLGAGFVYSQIAYACVRSGLLETLATRPDTLASLAGRLDLPLAGAERLLKGAAALQLVERGGEDRWALGPEGAALLGAPGVSEMIAHHALLYADLADPLALLRRQGGGGRLSGYWPYAEGEREGPEVADYSNLMAASQAMVSAQVLGAYDFRRHRRLLDVGGGDGTFLRSVAAAAPDLELSLFDLPAVTALARRRFAEAGVEADLHGGDFFHDPLPRGADLISFVRVLHDHGDAAVLGLLHQARAALPAGGSVLVAEPMAGVSGAERVGDAYFGFYLLAMGSGRPRTVEENRNLLLQAGFSRVRRVRTALPMIAVVLVAHN